VQRLGTEDQFVEGKREQGSHFVPRPIVPDVPAHGRTIARFIQKASVARGRTDTQPKRPVM
jgi:hypothetical protein